MSLTEIIPENVFFHIYMKIFGNLATKDLLNAGLTCVTWKDLTNQSYDRKGKVLVQFYFLKCPKIELFHQFHSTFCLSVKNALENCVIGFGQKCKFEVIGDPSLKIKPLPIVLKEPIDAAYLKLTKSTDGKLMVILTNKYLCYKFLDARSKM